MQVIDIIKQATELLSLTDENEVLNTLTKENESELDSQDVKRMFTIFKLMLNDFCTNYTPLCSTQNIKVEDNNFPIKDIVNFYKIKNIKNGNRIVNYKIVNKNIVINNGEYVVNYYSLPNVNSFFDELDFLSSLSPEVLVFGLCAFYCLSVGLFDEFKIYNEKYKSRAEAIKNLKIFEMPQRKWQWSQ